MTRFLLLLSLTLGAFTLSAQTEEDRARDDLDYYKSGDTREQSRGGGDLWYGAGAQLGFSSNQFNSLFVVGLSPIVGYKLNNFLSVGPRGAFTYNAYREDVGANDRLKINYITWEAGLFARAKVIYPFFAHVEYSLVSEARSFDRVNQTAQRVTRAVPFAGAGISQGGGPGQSGFEILVLIRLASAEFINDSPVVFRTGINYNF